MYNILYILEVSCYMNRCKGCLKQNSSIHGHNTRSKLNFRVEFCNTLYFRKVCLIWGIKPYNKGPESTGTKWDNFKLYKKRIQILTAEPFLSYTWSVFMVLSQVSFVSYSYQFHQINIVIPHLGIVLYCTGLRGVIIVLSQHTRSYFIIVTVW